MIIARDILIKAEFETPVVTDDWWLDLMAFSERDPLEGTFQEAMGWGRWGFPLPDKKNSPKQRGKRLAQAALQRHWQNKADELRISQITTPEKVLNFIHSMPGLTETCHEYPLVLAAYAPQLTIKGFGSEFEPYYEAFYRDNVSKHKKERAEGSIGGSGLTTNKLTPACDEMISLRHPTFGDYEAVYVAGQYFQGEIMGPEVGVYENIDYILWLLSDQSSWLPKKIHQVLLEGMKNGRHWLWDRWDGQYSNFASNNFTGVLSSKIYNAKKIEDMVLTKNCMKDIETRFEYTKQILNLKESIKDLIQRFLDADFIKKQIELKRERRLTQV